MHLQKRIFIVLLIILYFSSLESSAKNSLQDSIPTFNKEVFQASLKKLAPKEFARLFTQQYREDSIKVMICTKFIEDEMLRSDDLLSQFWGYYSLAHWQSDLMNHETSIKYIDTLYDVAKTMKDDDLILSALINKGSFYFKFGFYKESMEYNLAALELAKQTNNLKRELAISLNIAMIKIHTNDSIGAVELLEETLKIIENGDAGTLNILKTNIYIALVKGYIEIEDYKKAKTYCQKGLELSKNNNDKESHFYCLSFLGTIEGLHGNFENAHKLLDEALAMAINIKTIDSEIPMIYFEKGEVFYKEKKFKNAIDFLLRAEKLMEKNKINYITLEEIYALLAKSYNEIDDPTNSLKYYEKANEVYKANDKRQKNISVSILKKYDLKSLEEELNLSEEKTKKTRTTLYVSIFSAMLIVLGLIYFYRRREKSNQHKFEAILKSLEAEKEEIIEIDPEVEKIVVKEIDKTKTVKVEKTETKEIEIIDETKERLLKKLQKFEAKESYLSKHSSLNEVAKKLKTNTSYLSKLVNTHKGKSFTAYITDLRVNYAIKRLKNDKKFRSYTIDSIAQEIGFNRSESFSRAFKNKTGLYPSYFIKNLDIQNIE